MSHQIQWPKSQNVFYADTRQELIALETWPESREGDEPIATAVMEAVYQNGAVRPRLFSESEL